MIQNESTPAFEHMNSIKNNGVSKEKIEKAKWMIKEYQGAKLRSIIRRKKRPKLMKRLDVRLDHYPETGIIDYNHQEATFLIPEDQAYFQSFLLEMDIVWIVEHAIAAIPDNIAKAIAKDMINSNCSIQETQKKYNLSSRSARRKRQNVVNAIASILP